MATPHTPLLALPGGCPELTPAATADPAAPLARDRIAAVAYLLMLVATLTALGAGVVVPLLGL